MIVTRLPSMTAPTVSCGLRRARGVAGAAIAPAIAGVAAGACENAPTATAANAANNKREATLFIGDGDADERRIARGGVALPFVRPDRTASKKRRRPASLLRQLG